MKKVIDVSIGGMKFSLEEDAYICMSSYLDRFEKTIEKPDERKEIMEDVQLRVAEILHKEQSFAGQVVDIAKVQLVIEHLGELDEPAEQENTKWTNTSNSSYTTGKKRIYRSVDDVALAGICGGFATYLDIDTSIVRIIFVALVFLLGTGILFYLVLWLIIPKAETVAQKLELRGLAVTAENIKKFTGNNK